MQAQAAERPAAKSISLPTEQFQYGPLPGARSIPLLELIPNRDWIDSTVTAEMTVVDFDEVLAVPSSSIRLFLHSKFMASRSP